VNPHDILGVAPGATPAQIDVAWKTQLRKVHPDRHPDASPAELAELARRTASVNEARDQLLAAPTRPRPTVARCAECGATPARAVSFRTSGWLHRQVVTGVLCKPCALHHGRATQNQVLAGFWLLRFGVIALMVNAAALVTVATLADPGPGQRAHLDSGPPVTHRAGFAIFLVVPVLFVVFLRLV